tara:strand:- start:27 stop:584 length:558 start_codon:yes stop_codon:yes gene_type:complete
MKFEIKKPCKENFDEMTPCIGGRFCDLCEKEVIDFRNQKDNEIKDFFSNYKKEKICVIVNKNQVVPITIEQQLYKHHKKVNNSYPIGIKNFTLIFLFLIMFCAGCEIDSKRIWNNVIDPKNETPEMGEIAFPEKDTLNCTNTLMGVLKPTEKKSEAPNKTQINIEDDTTWFESENEDIPYDREIE